MKNYLKVLTVQDISCVGQCSLTTALPILSACGLETVILPSAVLSNHTAKGFNGFTFCDLTEEIPKIQAQWQKENISFDAVYTGYLGSAKQIAYVTSLFETVLKNGAKKIIDPAMADFGKLYTGFDANYVAEMKKLCRQADILLPNITEACYLTDTPYFEDLTKEKVENLLSKLAGANQTIVLTGVGFEHGQTGVAVYQNGTTEYYFHPKFEMALHGTGDVYASAFVGAYLQGKSVVEAAKIAADYTYDCIKITKDDKNHWYGVKFELLLSELIEKIQ